MKAYVFRILILSLILTAGTAFADGMTPEAVHALSGVPIMSGGRIKPFVSFAEDAVREVTGRGRWQGEQPVATVMGWIAEPAKAYDAQVIPVVYEPLRKVLGLEKDGRSHYSMSELLAMPDLRPLAEKAQKAQSNDEKLTVLQNKSLELMNRLAVMQAILTHDALAIVPNPGDPNSGWQPPGALRGDSSRTAFHVAIAYTGLVQSYRNGDWDIFATSANRLRKDLMTWHQGEINTSRLKAEVWYRRYDPLGIARIFYLLVLLLLLAGVAFKPRLMQRLARISLFAGFLVQTVGLVLRWYVGGRAPWSNMYESLVTISWGVLLLAQLPYKGFGKKVILPAAALIGFASLTIAGVHSLNPGINPLVPALRSYWLNIHVIIILLGYAAGTLAMGAGHAWLAYDVFQPDNKIALNSISQAIYRLVQFAVLFLIVGIILGSVWANSAWGRYWGWDPKETWALITWLFYLSLIHARFAGWMKQRGLAVASVLGFLLVLMTYYGVNYFLSGLHSYAKGEAMSVPPLIIGFVILELGIIAAYYAIISRRHGTAAL